MLIFQAKNINGKKSFQKIHNGEVVDERFEDQGASSIHGRSRGNALR